MLKETGQQNGKKKNISGIPLWGKKRMIWEFKRGSWGRERGSFTGALKKKLKGEKKCDRSCRRRVDIPPEREI